MAAEGVGASGYTLEQLADYHDRGRTPPVPEIEGDPECRGVLDAMDRFGALSRELVEADAGAVIDESWFQQVLGEVARESRAGRDLPVSVEAGGEVRLVMTEGALRGLVRDAGDSVDGVLVERVDVVYDEAAAALEVVVTVSAVHGAVLPDLADRVRAAVRDALERRTGWAIGAVDVTIADLHRAAPAPEKGEAR